MQEILDFLRQSSGWWSLAVIFAAAALEYFVPPLPGDSIVLAGSLLVVAGAWSFGAVAGAAVAGGFAGSAAHYVLGRVLRGESGELHGGRWIERLTGRGSLDRFFVLFQRHGLWLIAVNRMFPGIRAVAFLAAGAALLPPLPTLALGLLSNLVWSLGVLALGVTIGDNLPAIERAFGTYKLVALGLGLVVAGVFFTVRWRARRAAR